MRVVVAALAISARAIPTPVVTYCGRASFGWRGGYLQQHRHRGRRDGSKSAKSFQKLTAGSVTLRFGRHFRIVAHIFSQPTTDRYCSCAYRHHSSTGSTLPAGVSKPRDAAFLPGKEGPATCGALRAAPRDSTERASALGFRRASIPSGQLAPLNDIPASILRLGRAIQRDW